MLYVLAEKVLIFKDTSQGTTIQGVTKNALRNLQIPLPPLEVQKEIVAEIEGYQNEIAHLEQHIIEKRNAIQTSIAKVWGTEESV